jgi:hypothetical protein
VQYYRANLGAKYPTIHKEGCMQLSRAKKAAPWNWAEGKTEEELVRLIAGGEIPRHRLCRYCFGEEAEALERWGRYGKEWQR